MKNRKRIITTLIGMTLTAQLSPVAYTVVNAQEVSGVVQGQDQQEKTGLAANKITLGGNGCWEQKTPEGKPDMHRFEITFNNSDPKNMTLSTNAVTGYYGTDHSFHEWCPGEYIKVALISGRSGRIKKQVAISGKENIQKLKDGLDGLRFEYGDYLMLFHGEGMQRTAIEGPVFNQDGTPITNYDSGINKDILNEYQFKITPGGLQQVSQKIKKVNSADELINELINLKGSKRQETIELTKSITFDNDDVINKLSQLSNDGKKEVIIPEGVTLRGINSSEPISINLNNRTSLVLKGNCTGLENIIIENSIKEGVQIYNSSYSSLKKVTVKGCEGYGIFSNGSRVAMEDCKTLENKKGGVLISTSAYIKLSGLSDSIVIFKSDSNKFNEDHQVVVKDLQLINERNNKAITEMEENTFKVEYGKMGNDKGPNAYKSTDYDIETGLSSEYNDILIKKHPDIKPSDVRVEEVYKDYKLVL